MPKKSYSFLIFKPIKVGNNLNFFHCHFPVTRFLFFRSISCMTFPISSFLAMSNNSSGICSAFKTRANTPTETSGEPLSNLAKVWRLHCALAATISMVKFLLILAILSCSPITQRFSASCLVIQFAFVNFVIAYNVTYTQQRY
ncbi:Uncharacterised protein [Segatella copri]|nr:Uncharacterised protein [Segatella copri]